MSDLRRLQLHAAKLSVSGVFKKSKRHCGEWLKPALFFCKVTTLKIPTDSLWDRRRSIRSGPARKGVGCARLLAQLFGIPCRKNRVRTEYSELHSRFGRVERQIGHVKWDLAKLPSQLLLLTCLQHSRSANWDAFISRHSIRVLRLHRQHPERLSAKSRHRSDSNQLGETNLRWSDSQLHRLCRAWRSVDVSFEF